MRGVRCLAHRFLATGHHDLRIAIDDLLKAERHRTQAGPAELIHHPGGCFDRKARLDGGLTGRVLALRRGQNLAHDDLIHIRRRHIGPFQHLPDYGSAQIMRGDIGKCAVERAHRGARCRNDDHFFH